MAAASGPGVNGETREQILRAALRAFAEKGFVGASTRAIATAAGAHHGLIRHYFGSKQKLWQAAVDRAFAELEAELTALLDDDSIEDDRERAARVIRAHIRYVARNPEFVRLMHEEGKRRGPRMRWIADRHVKPLYESFRRLVERAERQGVLSVEMAPLHFFYVMAGATGVIFHQAEECKRVTGVDPFDPKVVEEHVRIVERLLLGESE